MLGPGPKFNCIATNSAWNFQRGPGLSVQIQINGIGTAGICALKQLTNRTPKEALRE